MKRRDILQIGVPGMSAYGGGGGGAAVKVPTLHSGVIRRLDGTVIKQ